MKSYTWPPTSLLLTLSEYEGSRSSCKAVVLNARQMTEPGLHHRGVFFMPKTQAHEWLISSKKKRQWMVVESSKAARLIVVLLDISHTNASMDAIQKDLPPQSSALHLQTRKPKL